MRINPGLQVVSVTQSSLRIGDPGNCLWMTGLSAAEHLFIRSLARPAGPRYAASSPLEADPPAPVVGARRREDLLARLRPVLVDEEEYRLPGALGSTLVPDVNGFSAAYATPAGHLVERRSRASVRLLGLGRCGQGLAALLAASGIGALHLHDAHPVAPGDIGTGPLRLADLGKTRSIALAHRLQQLWPRTRLTAWSPDAGGAGLGAQATVVVVRDHLPGGIAAHLAATRVPHLPVIFGPSWARIGPLVIPGLTACLDCAVDDIARPEGIPGGYGADAPSSTAELTLSAVAAGLAAMQVMMLLDGVNVPSSVDATLLVDLSSGDVLRHPVQPRPGCTCMIPAA